MAARELLLDARDGVGVERCEEWGSLCSEKDAGSRYSRWACNVCGRGYRGSEVGSPGSQWWGGNLADTSGHVKGWQIRGKRGWHRLDCGFRAPSAEKAPSAGLCSPVCGESHSPDDVRVSHQSLCVSLQVVFALACLRVPQDHRGVRATSGEPLSARRGRHRDQKRRVRYDRSMQQDNESDGFGLHFSPTDHTRLAAVGHDIIVWDVESGENRDRFDETLVGSSFIGIIFAVFSPDGRTIATAETGSGREVQWINEESGNGLSMDGNSFGGFTSASFSVNSQLQTLNPEPRTPNPEPCTPNPEPCTLNPEPCTLSQVDGSKIAAGSWDGSCEVWDALTGARLRTIRIANAGHAFPQFGPFPNAVRSVSWGRDWVQDTQRAMVFAMGHHPRLGEGSWVLELEAGVVRMILDRV